MSTFHRRALFAASFCLWAAALPSAARADTDACTLLAPADVGAAVGIPVGSGQHVTPTFVKTCTWTPTGKSAVTAVTLNLQTAAVYEGGKQTAMTMAAGVKGGAVKPASVGDDAYYFIAGEQVGLLVKKGGVSFKVAIYAKIPLEQKEAMELALARKVVGKL